MTRKKGIGGDSSVEMGENTAATPPAQVVDPEVSKGMAEQIKRMRNGFVNRQADIVDLALRYSAASERKALHPRLLLLKENFDSLRRGDFLDFGESIGKITKYMEDLRKEFEKAPKLLIDLQNCELEFEDYVIPKMLLINVQRRFEGIIDTMKEVHEGNVANGLFIKIEKYINGFLATLASLILRANSIPDPKFKAETFAEIAKLQTECVPNLPGILWDAAASECIDFITRFEEHQTNCSDELLWDDLMRVLSQLIMAKAGAKKDDQVEKFFLDGIKTLTKKPFYPDQKMKDLSDDLTSDFKELESSPNKEDVEAFALLLAEAKFFTLLPKPAQVLVKKLDVIEPKFNETALQVLFRDAEEDILVFFDTFPEPKTENFDKKSFLNIDLKRFREDCVDILIKFYNIKYLAPNEDLKRIINVKELEFVERVRKMMENYLSCHFEEAESGNHRSKSHLRKAVDNGRKFGLNPVLMEDFKTRMQAIISRPSVPPPTSY